MDSTFKITSTIEVGSCWLYARDDRSLYRGCTAIVLRVHVDALGDADVDVLMTPGPCFYEIQDTILHRHFTRIDA